VAGLSCHAFVNQCLLKIKKPGVWFYRIGLTALLLVVSFILAKRTQLYGDGAEYLLMTHALSSHASADIRGQDLDFFLSLPDATINRLRIQKQDFQRLTEELKSPSPDQKWINRLGFYAGKGMNFYSCHFWLYSLLVVPFYWLGLGLGLGPVGGFTLFHAALLAGALFLINKILPRQAYLAAAAFLSCGISFYMTWTGPEILTAVCTLGACILTLRVQPGAAILLAGLGAAQNPPLVFLIPLIAGFTLLSRKSTFLIWPKAPVWKGWPKQIYLSLVGLVLAGMPYVFFWIKFDLPSLIAHHHTNINLATLNRLHSLFFDLNQGMVVGVPGLILIWMIALVWLVVSKCNRRLIWLPTGLMLATMLIMAYATLPATNWNAGCRVMVRYAFWLAMPLLALLFFYLTVLPERIGRGLLVAVIAVQAFVMLDVGVWGQRYDYLRQTRLACWVLDHHPRWYNPEVEIFMERVLGAEGAVDKQKLAFYPQTGTPLKVLRHWSNGNDQGGPCVRSTYLSGQGVHEASDGWEYHHPPYECIPYKRLIQEGFWNFARGNPVHRGLLAKGWSFREPRGIWTDEILAELHVPVPNGMKPRQIRFSGRYSGLQRESLVSINGRYLGRFSLADSPVRIPESLRSARDLVIRLEHPHATSPFIRGISGDHRMLGFFLTALRLE
jgi:hypothetical protein